MIMEGETNVNTTSRSSSNNTYWNTINIINVSTIIFHVLNWYLRNHIFSLYKNLQLKITKPEFIIYNQNFPISTGITADLGTRPFCVPLQHSNHFSSTSSTTRSFSPSLYDKWPLSEGNLWFSVLTTLERKKIINKRKITSRKTSVGRDRTLGKVVSLKNTLLK